MSVQVINTLTDAYNKFNEKFFENKLTPCVITLGKRAGALGVYMPHKWTEKETQDRVPEIRMVSKTFKDRSTEQILSTLLHEQTHHWRATICDKKKTIRHHDKHWASKMKELGLKPYNVKNPEKETGYACSHNIVEGGPFDKLCKEMIEQGAAIKYFSDESSVKSRGPRAKKSKYVCPICETVIKGAPGLNIHCNDCDVNFKEVI
jgi:predicted SprT family Zn-dependent metalloprotease